MARESQKDRLRRYHRELKRAMDWREAEGYDDTWRDCIDLYQGKGLWPTVIGNAKTPEDRIAVNIAFSTLNVVFPSVSMNHPKIEITATKPEDEDRAVFNQAILNFQWDHYDFQDPFREAVKDSLVVGHGWVKVMWTYSEAEKPLSDEEFAMEFESRLQEAEMAAASGMANVPSDEEIAEQILTSATVTEVDRPVMERISPFDMYVNPEATTMRNIRWIAQRIVRNVDDVREDENYAAGARKKVSPGLAKLSSNDPRYQKEHLDPDLCEIWEFYDLVEGTVCVFADGGNEYLVKPTQMPYAMGHPFEMIANYSVPDRFYAIGDLEMIKPLVQELSKTRSEMLNHRAKYARKYVARGRAIARGDVPKITSRRDGEVILVEDDNVPLDDVIKPIEQVPMDAGLYNWSELIENDIQEVSGVSEFMRGGGGDIRRTATEAALIQDASNARRAEKLSQVERFVSRIAEKLLAINQQFMTGDAVARIVGREGQLLWLPYNRDDIIGEYDFNVEAGSTQPNDEATRRQNAMAVANIAAPFIELGVANPIELFRHLLREGFGIRNPEKFMVPQAAQMMAMQQQAQMAAMQQQMMMGEAQAMQAQMGMTQPPPGIGVDAPQDSTVARTDDAEAAEDEAQAGIAGVNDAQLNQLAGQVGLNI